MEKRLYLLIALLAFLTLPAGAQVIILNDNILQGRMCEIRATVLDSLTNEQATAPRSSSQQPAQALRSIGLLAGSLV